MQFDRKTFFDMYRIKIGHLTKMAVSGLKALLTFIERDSTCTSIQYIAYVLATVYHETAHTFQPIEEYGKGKGRSYGKPDTVTKQTYYGRGYVQLTWKRNYELFERLLDIPLVHHPEKALDAATAYQILSIGMYKGLYTGKKLGDYINTCKTDYVNARRVVNGVDKAKLIASYAKKFEEILTKSLVGTKLVNEGADTKLPITPLHNTTQPWYQFLSNILYTLTKNSSDKE